MSQVMKANVTQRILLQNQLEVLGHIVGLIRNTQVVDKNVIALRVTVSAKAPAVVLPFLHAEQQFSVLRDQRH